MVAILTEADTTAWAEEGVQEGAAIKTVINQRQVTTSLATITIIVISTIEAATTEATGSVRMVKKKILLWAKEEGVSIAGEAKITTAMADLKRKAPNNSSLQKTNSITLANSSSSGANR